MNSSFNVGGKPNFGKNSGKDQEEDAPIDAATLRDFVEKCLDKLPDDEKATFIGMLSALVNETSSPPPYNGDRRAPRPGMDSAQRARNARGFLERHPEAARVRLTGL